MDNWEETKQYIRELPNNYEKLIEDQMKKDPLSVYVIKDREKGNMYEWRFFHNGFKCFVGFQEIKKGDKNIVRYMAFNEEKSICFLREPLLEDLLD